MNNLLIVSCPRVLSFKVLSLRYGLRCVNLESIRASSKTALRSFLQYK